MSQAEVTRLDTNDIVRGCEDQTRRFHERLTVDTRFCFELFRRALALGNSEAFAAVFNVYRDQVTRWITAHRMFGVVGDTADLFVSEAFVQMYRYCSGDKFERFGSLEAILSYLQKCAVSALLGHLRRLRRQPETLPLEDNIGARATPQHENAQALWSRVNDLLKSPEDRLLVDLRFRQGLSPARIVELDKHWKSAREVTVALQRICRILAKDPEMRAFLQSEFVPDDL